VLIADVYCGVYRITSQVYEPKGYRFTYVPAAEFDEGLASHLDEEVRLVWVETPSNPLLNVVDIRKAADAAHAAGALLIVDNTFATPYLQQPLELGADAVVHSTTKYLGGLATRSAASSRPTTTRLPSASFLRSRSAPCPARSTPGWCCAGSRRSPCACASTVRTRAASPSSSTAIPASSGALPRVAGHPGHEVARKQMRDFGGMVSFLAESEQEAPDLVARTRIFQLAESLGGVESLIEHPARMTHASTASAPFSPPGNRARLSVGIEPIDDLLADLEAALARGRQPAVPRTGAIEG
jgi:cystathionine gamma-synthase